MVSETRVSAVVVSPLLTVLEFRIAPALPCTASMAHFLLSLIIGLRLTSVFPTNYSHCSLVRNGEELIQFQWLSIPLFSHALPPKVLAGLVEGAGWAIWIYYTHSNSLVLNYEFPSRRRKLNLASFGEGPFRRRSNKLLLFPWSIFLHDKETLTAESMYKLN